ALECPVTPRRDDLDIWVQGIGRKLETNLVVTLTCCTMRNRISASLLGYVDKVLGDQRTCHGCAEQIDAFVNGIGAEHREYEIANSIFAYVFYQDFLDADHLGLLASRLKHYTLAKVSCEGNSLRAKLCLQPFQDD